MIKLVDAIRLDNKTRLAFVGGGGKTTAMFQLARQFPTPVIVTTTTHLGTEQGALADIHFALTEDASFPDIEKAILENQVILLTGEPHADARLGSIPGHILVQAKAFADDRGIPLIIEADGSRKLPIKAPAENEPVIPAWVNAVIVTAGLSSISQPASEDTVHRFAHFSRISGIQSGELISLGHIEKMLVHPLGGLKGIPDGARRIVLLNQADDAALAGEAASLADRLVGVYDAALVASLKPEGRMADGVSGVKYCAERIAGIILAAGGASRYGQPKSLLVWQGETLIRRIARTALAAGLDPLVVVLGSTVRPIQDELSDMPVKFIINRDWKKGQSSSLRVAIEGLAGQDLGGAIILQADQPRVPATLLRHAIERHAENVPAIVVPRVNGHPSSPVLFDQHYFTDLVKIEGDKGGRALFGKFPTQWLDWEIPGDLMDIDTPQDFQRLLERDDKGS